MKPKVRVLMSTYNGEKFLKEQIESVLNQTDVDVRLTIRDDGSTDCTCNLLSELSGLDKRITVVYGENLGYKNSFLSLLSGSEYDDEYFAFADQDDVWEKDKLSSGIEKLKDIKGCGLYFSALNFVDENLNRLKTKQFRGNKDFWGEISYHNAAGCTFVFNRGLYNNLQKIDQRLYPPKTGHDQLVMTVCCLLCGTLVYDDVSHILFRRHGNNESTASGKMLKKIQRHFQSFFSNKNERLKLLAGLKQNFDGIDKKIAKEMEQVIAYKSGIKKKAHLLFSKLIRSGNIVYDLFLRTLVLFGDY